jgi:hypothetical protein
MPPKKRKRKAKTPKSTQRQSQRQSVVVNIGSTSKSKPRKSSGRGGLPPPSHMHNLAPTFVTAPQVDYTPLLAMMQHHASPIVAQAPMPVQNLTTPLSSATIATNTPSQMAREAALRRAGRTADNFQSLPSQADEQFAQQEQQAEQLRSEFLKRSKSAPPVLPEAQARPKRGRPRKSGVQPATPVNAPLPSQAAAEPLQQRRVKDIASFFEPKKT